MAVAVWLVYRDGADARLRAITRAGAAGGVGARAGAAGGTPATAVGEGEGRGATTSAISRLLGKKEHDDGADSPVIAVIDRCVQLLKVGIEPARVMRLVADLPSYPTVERVLRKVSRAMELGEAPHAALNMHAAELEEEDERILRGLASVWFVAEHAGAPAADMLASYAVTCRDRADAVRERDVALAGPTSTVMVLSWLPIISLGLAVLVGANLVELLTSVAGIASVGGGLVMLLAGRVWMRSMLNKAR